MDIKNVIDKHSAILSRFWTPAFAKAKSGRLDSGLLILASVLLLLSSCVSNKKYIYLQDKGNVKADSNGTMTVIPYAYKLQKGDILYISLTTEDEKLNKIFVPGAGGGQILQQQQGVSGSMLYFIGFTIDKQGEIEFPYLGKIKVTELDVEQAKMAIEEQLKKYFKVFFLQVKVAEFKFSVLGYVNKPGQYFFQQNKVTIIEAIAMAGDLQNLAKRYSLQLFRQYPDGVKIHSIDITDRQILNSPFWFIQPNDVLYIEPLKIRTAGDLSSFQSTMTVLTPLLSSLLLVLNTYILIENLK
jgi:polysaccharide export outer membrane protein